MSILFIIACLLFLRGAGVGVPVSEALVGLCPGMHTLSIFFDPLNAWEWRCPLISCHQGVISWQGYDCKYLGNRRGIYYAVGEHDRVSIERVNGSIR